VTTESKARCYSFKKFTLDLEKRLLLRDGEPVPLTPKAFDTLALPVRRSGRVVSKDELLEEIWADAASNLPAAGHSDLRPAERHTRSNVQTKWLAPSMLLLAVAVAAGFFR
jgi:hypothetical protein